jgi:hypothetical protein
MVFRFRAQSETKNRKKASTLLAQAKTANCCTCVYTHYRMEHNYMAKQTFPAGAAPRIVLNGCSGDLDIEVWDERAIEI